VLLGCAAENPVKTHAKAFSIQGGAPVDGYGFWRGGRPVGPWGRAGLRERRGGIRRPRGRRSHGGV